MSWLWKSDTSSPASYEKALSKLSTQLTSANVSLESSRSHARRTIALWTLYTILAYLVSAAILILVIGPQNWHTSHYVGLGGAPVLIYSVRTLLRLIFDWQIERKQAHVENLQKQRETKINELKKATKYDTTQELLHKYGATTRQTPSKPQQGTKRKIVSAQDQPQRTGLPPPPTANIVRPGGSVPNTPQRQDLASLNGSARRLQSSHSLTTSPVVVHAEEPGFAPNAFEVVTPPSKSSYDTPKNWYDRLLDVVLGEDETLAKHRLALICSMCRLVNGQAPPGVQTLEQVGVWRCSNCGAANGVESESNKIMKEVKGMTENRHEQWPRAGRDDNSLPEDNLLETDGVVKPETSEIEVQDSGNDDAVLGKEEGVQWSGKGQDVESDISGQEMLKRTRRTEKEVYDDDDQGW